MIFKVFLPYMGVSAILVMCPRPYEHTFVTPPHGGSKSNLVSIGPVVLEEMPFENVNDADNHRLFYMLVPKLLTLMS